MTTGSAESAIVVDKVGQASGGCDKYYSVACDFLSQGVVCLHEGICDVTVGRPHVQNLLVPVL